MLSDDDKRRELERKAAQGDEDAVKHIQALNDRLGLTRYDAEYLEAYCDICDRLMAPWPTKGTGLPEGFDPKKGKLTYLWAEHELKLLNEKYKLLVGSKTLKSDIPGTHLIWGNTGWQDADYPPPPPGMEGREDHWVPSEVGC